MCLLPRLSSAPPNKGKGMSMNNCHVFVARQDALSAVSCPSIHTQPASTQYTTRRWAMRPQTNILNFDKCQNHGIRCHTKGTYKEQTQGVQGDMTNAFQKSCGHAAVEPSLHWGSVATRALHSGQELCLSSQRNTQSSQNMCCNKVHTVSMGQEERGGGGGGSPSITGLTRHCSITG